MKKKITVIQVLLILVVICCGGYTTKYFYDSHKAQTGFEELKQEVEAHSPKGDVVSRANNGMLEKYYGLYTRNNDMVGWLNIPGTVVDYPVVRHTDNDFYLHKNFDKEYQFSGIPFLDYQCYDGTLNSIIYAHNMRDGSMFAVITKFTDKAFYDAHKSITYDSLYNEEKYEIIAAFTTKVGADNEFKYYNYADMDDKRQFDEYVSTAKLLSFYDTGVTAQYGDKLLTLSTCAHRASNDRFVIVAKKV
ncbi:MAG: class B sortase [Oscillospiraceae bacterium]|nr:class B sortase [Oscillospiraceae bacterium]